MADADTIATVQNLNIGWRNYLTQLLSLDKDKFQCAQGGLGLQTSDSSGLFLMENAVPAPSLVGYYDPSTTSSKSSSYLALLNALLPETNPNGLQQALGDMYASWVTYKASLSPWPANLTLLQAYNTWSNTSPIDPGRASRGQAAIMAAMNSNLIRAYTAYGDPANQQKFIRSDGTAYYLYTYSGTNQNAVAAIASGSGPFTVDFDSRSMDTSSTSTVLSGGASGFYDIFSAGVGGSLDQESAKAAGSSFTIKGTINKVGSLQCFPGNWFSADEFNRALNAKGDNTIWDPGASAGNWDSFFGQPGGSLARAVSALVLVSDYDITVTSHASYSQSEFQKITANASFGIWPFFSAGASSTQTSSMTLNSDSSLTMSMSLGKGLIQIWGAIVDPV